MTEIVVRQMEEPVDPTFGLSKFRDPLPVPPTIRPRRAGDPDAITVHAVSARMRLHSQLPETTVWGYDGHFPGPTIEVRSGEWLRVAWVNAIQGTMPLLAVSTPVAPSGTPPAELSSNNPGYPRNPDGTPADGAAIIDGVAELPGWLVTHVHGADANGGNDGWAHNAVLNGHAQLTEHPNEQRSAMLWYHDHAMAITRWNVHAGLLGAYLIRDEQEEGLGLPSGDFEIPLVINDRNLDVDSRGTLTGQLLFKVDAIGTALIPFLGPFTLVNGAIWPHLDVEARWYRFRLVNTSNARFYRLNLINEAGETENAAVRQIGTDGGLLAAPAELPEGGLVLAPAERADLLVDFGRPELRGRRLRWTNTAANAALQPDLMEFRVEDRVRHDRFALPGKPIAPAPRRPRPDDDHTHQEVWVALVPPGTAGEAHPQMWDLHELTDPADIPAELPVEGIVQLTDPATGVTRTFQRVAALFDDTVSVFIERNTRVVWNFVSFGGPAHPMHIHLVQFQAMFRRGFTPSFDVAVGGTSSPATDFTEIELEAYEKGWKDVISVDGGDWVRVVGEFGASTGEFMFHCHILDHEDEGMMRPFLVHPPEVARFHVHRGGHMARARWDEFPSP